MTIARTVGRPPEPGTLKGWHVLLMLLAFFGVMLGVNLFMTYEAITTFRGADTDSVYQAGRLFPREMAAARDQTSLNWTVAAHVERSADGVALLTFAPRDKLGQPIAGLLVTVRLEHPSDRYRDRTVTLAEQAPGLYGGNLVDVTAGVWDAVFDAAQGDARVYRTRNRVILP